MSRLADAKLGKDIQDTYGGELTGGDDGEEAGGGWGKRQTTRCSNPTEEKRKKEQVGRKGLRL